MAFHVILGLSMLWSGSAEARPHHHRPPPRPAPHVRVHPAVPVAVHVARWLINTIPDHRPGYVWVDGYWRGRRYTPGHWRPIAPPPGPEYVWVDGHWESDSYVDGYWRMENIDGMIWVDGEYNEEGYLEGHWEDGEGQVMPEEALPEDVFIETDTEDSPPLAVPVEQSAPTQDVHHPPPDMW